MKFLNDLADEAKRKKMLKDVNLVIDSLGGLASVLLPLVQGRSATQGK